MSVRSGSMASSIEASASSSSVRSRATSHAVRRDRTSRHALRLGSQLEADAAPIASRLPSAARGRLTSRVTCRDIAAGETPSLAASSRIPTPGLPDGDEQRHLSSVTPSGCTSAELPRELKQDWPQPARYGKWVDGDGRLAQFVNQVNKTVSSASGWLRCLGIVVATITRRQKSLISSSPRGRRTSCSGLLDRRRRQPRVLQPGCRGDARCDVRGSRRASRRRVANAFATAGLEEPVGIAPFELPVCAPSSTSRVPMASTGVSPTAFPPSAARVSCSAPSPSSGTSDRRERVDALGEL